MKNRFLYQLICIWNDEVFHQKSTCFGKLYYSYKYYSDFDGIDFVSLRVLDYDETGAVSCIDTIMEKYNGESR